jgi:heme/copper-type cytochrome/quinol oxidase subunit 1
MTTIDPHVAGAGAAVAGERADGLLVAVADWITTTDHKKIGRMFIGTSLVLLIASAVIGVVLGAERIDASSTSIDIDALPQLFSLFRIVLTLGVVVPLGLGLGIAVVPLQLGARSLAAPRLAALGFFLWLLGTGMVIGSIIANGGPGGGDPDMVDFFLSSAVLMVLGLITAAGSLAMSILTTRAPGMNMRRVPLFSWSVLVYALGLLLALPVLVGVLVVVFVDHRNGRLLGGNTAIGDWLDVSLSQPATVLYSVPVFGLLLETVATATRRRLPMRGIGLIGVGLVGTALLAGVGQVHAGLSRDFVDMQTGDALRELVPFAALNALPLLGALVVSAVFLLALKGRPRPISPLLFAFLGSEMVFVGIAGNVLYHIGDAQLARTVFEEAAWIYVCYGTVLAIIGGIVYWAPKLWGRAIDERKVLPLALLGVVATVLASFPHYIAGFAKQPGGMVEFDYSGPQDLWNTLVTVGHGLMALTVLAFVALAIRSLRSGPTVGDDPWDGQTLEWATTSPAPADNFAEIHVISSAEPLVDLKPARENPARQSQGAPV